MARCLLRSGARWHDLPERYGKYKSVHARFMRWARSGMWERIFADLVRDKKSFYLMLDSTIVRAHQQAAAGRKKGLRRPDSGAFPRRSEHQNPSADGRKRPAGRLPHHARPGSRVPASDPAARRSTGPGCDRRQGLRLGRDRRQGRSLGAVAVIPPRRHWRQPKTYDRELYKQRNRIERCFNGLKHFRRFSTRYCRTIEAFRATTALACAWIRLPAICWILPRARVFQQHRSFLRLRSANSPETQRSWFSQVVLILFSNSRHAHEFREDISCFK